MYIGASNTGKMIIAGKSRTLELSDEIVDIEKVRSTIVSSRVIAKLNGVFRVLPGSDALHLQLEITDLGKCKAVSVVKYYYELRKKLGDILTPEEEEIYQQSKKALQTPKTYTKTNKKGIDTQRFHRLGFWNEEKQRYL